MRHESRPRRITIAAAIALGTALTATTVTLASADSDSGAAPAGTGPQAREQVQEQNEAQARPLAETCEAFGTIDQGKYWLNNNLWGQDSGSGSQCVRDAAPTQEGTIAWGTDWEWSGEETSVKSFVSAVLGWHWSEIDPASGLPVQVSSGTPVNTVWDYQVSDNPGTMNVAYDLWLHSMNNPTWENDPTDEIMIWPYSAGGAGPIGEQVATVEIGGGTWALHEGNIGWDVYSFVRTDNTTSVEFDLMDFLNYLAENRGLDASKYLTSVQAGTEVFVGSGSLETSRYATDVG
jgi:xyloglucan-specific endo-beta-1,4-glucanase